MAAVPVYIQELCAAARHWDFGPGFRAPQHLDDLRRAAPEAARLLSARPSAEISLILRACGEAEVNMLYDHHDARELGLVTSTELRRRSFLRNFEQRLHLAYERQFTRTSCDCG